MAYTKTNWQALPSTTTPINPTNLNNIENGIKTNDDKLLGTKPMGNIVVDSIRTKNMFNQYNLNRGYFIPTNDTSENLSVDASAYTTNWIPCKPNTKYIMSGTNYNRYRCQLKTSTGTITYTELSSNKLTTASDTAYFRIYFYYGSATTFNNVQIEEGETATTYSPYQQLDRPTIQTGSGTINSTYIDTVELNHYEKSGNVVSYSFTMKTKGTWGNTTEFISGLPKAKKATRFIGINGNNGTIFRFEIWSNGTIRNAYSPTTPPSGAVLEAHVVYMTED